MASKMCRSTNRQAEPEIYFRIVHLAQEGYNCAPVVPYREQTVEIAHSGQRNPSIMASSVP